MQEIFYRLIICVSDNIVGYTTYEYCNTPSTRLVNCMLPLVLHYETLCNLQFNEKKLRNWMMLRIGKENVSNNRSYICQEEDYSDQAKVSDSNETSFWYNYSNFLRDTVLCIISLREVSIFYLNNLNFQLISFLNLIPTTMEILLYPFSKFYANHCRNSTLTSAKLDRP